MALVVWFPYQKAKLVNITPDLNAGILKYSMNWEVDQFEGVLEGDDDDEDESPLWSYNKTWTGYFVYKCVR